MLENAQQKLRLQSRLEYPSWLAPRKVLKSTSFSSCPEALVRRILKVKTEAKHVITSTSEKCGRFFFSTTKPFNV
jgi:hypothetical protein